MAGKKSATVHRILLVLAALAVVIAVFLAGKRILEPASVPMLMTMTSKAHVRFNPEADIRKNSLFETLKAFITGNIDVGILGNPRPFVNPDMGMRLEDGQQSRLTTMEEIPLQGASARDITPDADGGMLVLLAGAIDEQISGYEIRSYAADGSAETWTDWQDASELDRTPTVFTESHDGLVWLGNALGGVGSLEQGGSPVWFGSISTGLEAPVTGIIADSVDHIWVTDGLGLSVGGTSGFTPVDLLQQFSDSQREEFVASIADVSSSYRGSELGYDAARPEEALLPERLSVSRDGRLGIATGLTAFRYGLNIQARPDWINTLAVSSTIPLIVGPNGAVWGRRLEDSVLMRVWATGTRAYLSTLAAPSYTLANPQLFTQNASRLYTVDYAPEGTSVLWSTEGDEWLSQLIVASGTVPLDTPVKAEVDREGNVWLLMRQGGVVRIKQAQSEGI